MSFKKVSMRKFEYVEEVQFCTQSPKIGLSATVRNQLFLQLLQVAGIELRCAHNFNIS